MKAKANHWVKYNGTWHKAGELFVIEEADAADVAKCAEIMKDGPAKAEKVKAEDTEPVKRGRKRKTEE